MNDEVNKMGKDVRESRSEAMELQEQLRAEIYEKQQLQVAYAINAFQEFLNTYVNSVRNL